MTAAELLAAFSGECAQQFEPFFQYSEESRIVGVETHAVGMESTTVRYSGQEEAKKEVNNILRISCADGFEGVSGVDSYTEGRFSDKHFSELRNAAQELQALKSLDPVEVGTMLEKAYLSDAVRSSIDIALWDLAARKSDRPLCELLCATRDSIQSYASLPFFGSLPEYIEAVHQCAELGHSTFKFHVWGSIEEDVRLVELLQKTFADTPYRFMIDLEEKYSFADALRLGEQMDKGMFIWLEGPIRDELLEQYAELKSELDVQIVPDGYHNYSPEFVSRGIEVGSWDAGRFDATTIGGVSKALELLIIADDAGLSIELQSWGYSLTQAVNLHIALANQRTRYFEAPMPGEPFEFAMRNGILLDRGRAVAPDGPGLGINVGWESLAAADFYLCSRHGNSISPGD